MGNWRTVNITGTISDNDVPALRERLGYSYERNFTEQHFGPLSFSTDRPSLAGLNNWVAPTVFACGNLAERDYSVEDVADELRDLVTIAPSMLLKVHCGGDWESEECIATISVGEGIVAVGKAEVAKVAPVSDAQAAGNLMINLYGPQR